MKKNTAAARAAYANAAFTPNDFYRIEHETLCGDVYRVEYVATRRAYGVTYDATFTVEPTLTSTVCELSLKSGYNGELITTAWGVDLRGACNWFNARIKEYNDGRRVGFPDNVEQWDFSYND